MPPSTTCIKVFLLVLLSCRGVVWAELVARELTYESAGQTLHGFLVYDDAWKTTRPGVLVVHEWWGQNAFVRARARQVAELGYVAFAIDMYGEGKTVEHPVDAAKLSNAVLADPDTAAARFRAAVATLRAQPQVDAGELGAVGYGFGGTLALNMARQGLPLRGVVAFHAPLTTTRPAEPGVFPGEILVCNGGADPMVHPLDVSYFKHEMQTAGIRFAVKTYPEAKQAFTNPGSDALARKYNLAVGYNPDADADSWREMERLFERVFPDLLPGRIE